MRRLLFLILGLILFQTKIFAQQLYFPLGSKINIEINKAQNKINAPVNTGFKPLLQSELNRNLNFDSIVYQKQREKDFFAQHNSNWFYRKMFFEDFISVKKKNFTLCINPLLNLEFGTESDTSKQFIKNTRGIEFKGTIGKKVAFYSAFRENQAYYQPYISNFVNYRSVVPGQGAYKIYGTDGKGFDFSMATGYLSYSPTKWVNLQIGQDKNFIGEGHRSLLLSDNAFNYPFAKATFVYKGFKYVNLFTQFEDFRGKYYFYHTKKHSTFNYLSYNFKNWIEIGILEAAIFQTTDTAKHTVNNFPAEYFLPIIGTHTLKNGFSGKNNVLWGINYKIKVAEYLQLYGQIAIDDPAEKKNAYQFGLKVFDIFWGHLTKQNLYFQAEYNKANQTIYATTDLRQNWGHYNQELAHPLGNNFDELLLTTSYNFRNLYLKVSYSQANFDKSLTFSDIYQNYKGIYTTPATPKKVSHKTIQMGWVINPNTQLQFFSGFDRRVFNNTTSDFVFLGLKTDLSNFYYDF